MSETQQKTVTHPKQAPIVLGAVAFGKPKTTTRDHPLSSDESCDRLLKLFYDRGGRELDTARVYQNGNCEGVLGRLDIAKKIRIATKYNPTLPGDPEKQLNESLEALKQDSVPIFYLHMPATEINLEDTLASVQAGYEAGKFEEFGLSNFPGWQVVEICQYCQRKGFVLPTVYQGVYNALNRTSEYELVPVLRNYGIKYYTHGSLASGFLTGKYQKGKNPVPGVDRFAQKRRIKQYEERYLKRDEMFLALDAISDASNAAGIGSILEASVRWTQYHSAADGSLGDAVLIGVSRIEQLAPIMDASDNGPLPDKVVEAFEAASDFVRMKSEYYLQYPYPKEGSPWNSRLG
jgi:aflatoxin B1 aldehyde reductase